MGTYTARVGAGAWTLLLIISCSVQPYTCDAMAQQLGKAPVEIAERYVEEFKRGNELVRPSHGLLPGGQPDQEALRLLGDNLRNEGAEVRENIVNLLADIGTQSLSLRVTGIEAMTDPGVISQLAQHGLSKTDVARERAMELLRKYCLEASLKNESVHVRRALVEKPTTELLLLVAKAKMLEMKDALEELEKQEEWGNDEALLIAMASLGDTAVTNRFLKELDDANTAADPKEFGRVIRILSLIGTPEILRTVAENMRTPLVLRVVGSYEKTMRFAVLEGLSYNFPVEPVLYPNYIITEEDFREAEEFCERTLGAQYKLPVPAFMTYRGHPEPPAVEEK